MVEMIHKLTGSKMFVSEDRVEEYKAAGHKLAARPETEKPKAKKQTKSKK